MLRLRFILLTCLLSSHNAATQWIQTLGPEGGGVSSLSASGMNIFTGTKAAGMFLSTNNGTSWTAVNSGLANLIVQSLAINSTGDIFAGTYGGGIFRSTDKGSSWGPTKNVGHVSGNDFYVNLWIHNLAINSRGDIFASGNNGGFYRSNDNGGNWTELTGITIPGFSTTVVSIAFNSSNDVFAGVLDGGVFRSTDNGASWIQINNGLTNHVVWSLATNSSGHIFAGTYGAGVFRSTNNGGNWMQAGLANDTVWSLAIDSNGHVFAGTDSGGVFISTNKGTNWTAVNSGLPNTVVNVLAVIGTNLFVGTERGGVWKRSLSEMITSVGTSLSELPTKFTLEQNYPNPFNPSTTIRFFVPTSSLVTLKVYNLLGEEILTLVSERLGAGTYSLRWNANSLPSGVYFYRLQAGDLTETKKLILLR